MEGKLGPGPCLEDAPASMASGEYLAKVPMQCHRSRLSRMRAKSLYKAFLSPTSRNASRYGLETCGTLSSCFAAFECSCATAGSRPGTGTDLCGGTQILQSTVALENAS